MGIVFKYLIFFYALHISSLALCQEEFFQESDFIDIRSAFWKNIDTKYIKKESFSKEIDILLKYMGKHIPIPPKTTSCREKMSILLKLCEYEKTNNPQWNPSAPELLIVLTIEIELIFERDLTPSRLFWVLDFLKFLPITEYKQLKKELKNKLTRSDYQLFIMEARKRNR